MTDIAFQKSIILGGSGFIGTNLCRAMSERVETVRCFGRRLPFKHAMRGIEWVQGDFSDSASLASAIEGYDTVYHLVNATTPASANVDMIADLQANVVSTLRLLEACRLQKVRRIIFVSSGGTIYGVPEQIPTPETAPTSPLTAYGVSKLAIEKYLALYEHLYGLEYRVLRLANPYGAFQTAQNNQGVIAAIIRRSLAGRSIDVWGDGSVIRDYIYIDDVVDALITVAQYDGKERVFNIGSGNGHSLLEVITMIEDILGSSITINHLEGRTIDLPCSILDISRAKSVLNWHPETDLQQGLVKTIQWHRENMQL